MAGVKISELPVYPPSTINPDDVIPIVSKSSGTLTTYHVSAVNFVVSPAISVSSTITLPYTDPADVTITNTAPAQYELNFSIPQGVPGIAGIISSVSAVQTTQLSVSNIGTPNNARLLFTFPPPLTGATGPKGNSGDWSTPQVIKYLSGSGYMPTSADAGNLLAIETNAPTTLFVLSAPTSANGNFIVGQKVDFIRMGTTPVSCTSMGASTINGTPSLVLRDQYSSASLVYYKPNQWVVIGDLKTP